VAVDPVLAIVAVAVVANAVIMALVILPMAIGRARPPEDDMALTAERVIRSAAVTGRPIADRLGDGVLTTAYDRVVRVSVWTYLLVVAAIVAITGLWPDTQPVILGLVAGTAIAFLIVHDLLPAGLLGPAKFIVEGSLGITFASLLVLLTGQETSPFFFTFPLIVAGAALVVSPRVTVGLALAASIGYLVAVLLPIDGSGPEPIAVATVGVNLSALVLLAYVAMVISREQRRSREAAVRLSTVDTLTGLFNRSFLVAALEREIARSGRSGRGFCLLMMDLDGLKAANDRWGHHIGDEVLRAVGDQIRDHVRLIDTPARYGGDEFVVLCPETDPSGAYVLAEKIRSGIAGIVVDAPDQRIQPSVSVGVVGYPDDGPTADALLVSADRAMYASKRAGKDRVTGTAPRGEPVGVPIPVSPEPASVVAPGTADGRTRTTTRTGR
jgi:diguanylate cyclase (GGDEF)-like protein